MSGSDALHSCPLKQQHSGKMGQAATASGLFGPLDKCETMSTQSQPLGFSSAAPYLSKCRLFWFLDMPLNWLSCRAKTIPVRPDIHCMFFPSFASPAERLSSLTCRNVRARLRHTLNGHHQLTALYSRMLDGHEVSAEAAGCSRRHSVPPLPRVLQDPVEQQLQACCVPQWTGLTIQAAAPWPTLLDCRAYTPQAGSLPTCPCWNVLQPLPPQPSML